MKNSSYYKTKISNISSIWSKKKPLDIFKFLLTLEKTDINICLTFLVSTLFGLEFQKKKKPKIDFAKN